jgi:hypothetical protein
LRWYLCPQISRATSYWCGCMGQPARAAAEAAKMLRAIGLVQP